MPKSTHNIGAIYLRMMVMMYTVIWCFLSINYERKYDIENVYHECNEIPNYMYVTGNNGTVMLRSIFHQHTRNAYMYYEYCGSDTDCCSSKILMNEINSDSPVTCCSGIQYSVMYTDHLQYYILKKLLAVICLSVGILMLAQGRDVEICKLWMEKEYSENSYMYVIYGLSIVTYCSIRPSLIGTSGPRIETIFDRISNIQVFMIYQVIIITICTIVGISMIAQGQYIETLYRHRLITYMNVVITMIIVMYNSIVGISVFAQGQSTEIFNTRNLTTYMQVLTLASIIVHSMVLCVLIIAKGQCIETDITRIFIICMDVIINSIIVTQSSVIHISIIAQGQYIETFNLRNLIEYQNPVLYTVIVIIYLLVGISVIAQGQCTETFNTRIPITYMYVVIRIVIVTFSSINLISIIASGQYYETFNYINRKFKNNTQLITLNAKVQAVFISVNGSGRLIEYLKRYITAKLQMYRNYTLYFIGLSAIVLEYIAKRLIKVFFIDYQTINNFCRSWSCRELQSAASEATYSARERTVKETDLFLVPHVPDVHGSGGKTCRYPVSKTTVANRIAGYQHKKNWSTDKGNPDIRHMTAFLKNVPDPSMLHDPGLVDFDKLITCRAPIIDFLKVYYDMTGTWDYPPPEEITVWRTNRGISPQWFQGTTVTEYVVGSDQRFQDFVDLFWQNYNTDQEMMPTGVVSLDVEDKNIWRYDLLRMSSLRDQVILLSKLSKQEKLSEFPEHILNAYTDKENRKTNVPAKIMFGGVHWAMIISLGIERTDSGDYTMDCSGFPDEIIDFLESVPPVVGAGIKHDVVGIEKFVQHITGKSMQFKGYVELGVLATLAGWQLERRGMFHLSLITMGSTMNKLVSCCDSQWGIPFHELDPAMQCYAVGDTKMGHITYGVLIAAYLNQIAPDPDMACRLSNCSQYEWVSWFCSVVRESLLGLELLQVQPQMHLEDYAGTYQELVNIIRYRDIHGQVSNCAPDTVRFLASLVKWPSITRGGPRYLHPVRLHHISVYNAFKESSGFPGIADYFSREVEVEDRMYATFGHRDTLSLDTGKKIRDPELYDSEFSLIFHPDTIKPSLDMEFPLSIQYIHARSKGLGRGVREAILEWFRFDPSRIEQFFQNCVEDRELAVDFRGRHEIIRLMFVALMNREPLSIPETEESIANEVAVSIEKLRAFKAKLLEAVQQQDDILHELYLADSGLGYQNRYSWKKKPLPQVALLSKSIVVNSMGDEVGCTAAPTRSSSSVDGCSEGRPLAERLREFDVVEPDLALRPVLDMRMYDQCRDGGRHTSSKGKKKKSTWPSGVMVRSVVTQDMVEEEEVRVVRRVQTVGDFDTYCDEVEEFLESDQAPTPEVHISSWCLPPTPEIDVMLDD